MTWLLRDMSPFVAAPLFALAMLAGWWSGWRYGSAHRAAAADGVASGAGNDTSRLHDATLALLGLLLAFTFSMSLTRHEKRREMVVLDSNSIGDFLTCVELLDSADRVPLKKLLKEYVAERIALVHGGVSDEEFTRHLDQLEALQDAMRTHVDAAIRRSTPVVVPLVNTLNELTSSHAARLSAYRDRLPASIVLTLLVAAVVSMVMTGYREGIERTSHQGATCGFALLVGLVIAVTLDLNQPQGGLIRISQEPLQRLAASLNRDTLPDSGTSGEGSAPDSP